MINMDFAEWRLKKNLEMIPPFEYTISMFLNERGRQYSVEIIEKWRDEWIFQDEFNSYLDQRKKQDLLKIWTEN